MTFPKKARLLFKWQYKKVLQAGNRVTGRLIAIDYRMGRGSRPRLGITVSRRYGKAHLRNRFKRVVREAFRLSCHAFPPHLEVNVMPALSPIKPTKDAVLKELVELISHVEIPT